MQTKNDHVQRKGDKVLTISRLLNAPRELVFEVWTKPEHIKHWWGPRGFTNTISKMDVKPGGEWVFVMHGPDGTNYPNTNVFQELVKPERIVLRHVGPPDFTMIATFREQNGKTLLSIESYFDSAETLEKVIKAVKADKGLEENVDKLEEYLAKMPVKELMLTRVLNAPREVVFKAWTEVHQLAEWWGPRGFTNPVCQVDVREGGDIYIVMKGPDGGEYPMNGTFKEVVAPERLVFSSGALDKNNKPLFEVLTTVTFEPVGDKTKMTLHASVSNLRPEGRQHIEGMNEGWSQSLDRLERFTAVPVVIERTYNAPAAQVWKAISDKDEMKKWYFDLAEFRPEVGFEFRFEGGPDHKKFLHLCKVTEVIKGKRLTYSWRYDGYEGNSFVTFDLLPEGDKTTVRLTHVGLETFPAVAEFARHNFVAGWTDILSRSLKEFLELVESQARP